MIDRLNKIQINEEDISNRINALVSASNAYLCEATKVILEGQRHFGENQYTDGEISNLASQAVISQKAYDEILKNMDPANMSSHSANTFGVNVAELCSDIRTLKYEVVRAIMFNDSDTYIGYIEESNYSPVYVSQMCINNLFEQLKHNTECKSVILIHNHPYVICANTDDGDDKSSYINEKILNGMDIELIDDCIITEYDFYSRKQCKMDLTLGAVVCYNTDMNKTELQKIGQSLKEKYFDVGIKEMTEQLRDDYRYTYKLGREMLRSFDYSHLSEEEKEKRLLNNYTDEEIEEIVSKINMSDDNYNEYLNQFNPDYMSNCSTVTDFGFDIESVCGDLRMQDYEYVRILMFNESLKYIGMLEHTDYKKYSVSAYGVDEGIKDHPECKYVITLHNHPHDLCANTDDKDTWLYNKHKDEYKEKHNVEIIDDCIISEYDFYSRKQKNGTI